MANIQKYQLGKALQWLGTKFDDGYRLVHRPFVARQYAKMGVDVTAPQNAKIINALSRRSPIKISYDPIILKERLIAEGINPLLLSEKNLQHLVGLRQYDILQGIVPDRFALRTSVPTPSGPLHGYDLFRKTRSVGGITAHDTADGINTVVVQNLTKGTPNYVKGVSEQGYNAVIGDIGHIISGLLYQSPHISTKVMDKFHNKTFLGNIGRHDWSDVGGLIEFGPVWKLNEPTYNVPVKYLDIFNFEGLSPQGKFMIDFNKGPMFKYGGKIEKFWPGGIIKNGLKYVWNYGSDLINATKLNHIIKTTDISKAVRQSNLFDSHMKLTHNLLDSSPLFVRPTKAVSWADLGIDVSKPGTTQFMFDRGPLKSADDLLKKYPGISIDPKIGTDAWTIGKVNYSRPKFYVQHGDLLEIDGVNYYVGPMQFPAAKTNTLVHQGDVNIINGVMYPKPSIKGGTTAIWWEQNQPFYGPWSTPKSAFIIDDVVPTRLQPDVFGNIKTTRLTDAVDLKDPKLNFKFVRFDPISGEMVRSPFVFQTKPINYNY